MGNGNRTVNIIKGKGILNCFWKAQWKEKEKWMKSLKMMKYSFIKRVGYY